MISGDLNSLGNRQDEIERKKNEILMLKSCLAMKRLKLSVVINDLKNYCFEHIESDQLISAPKDDPFKTKRRCSLF
uniref:G protein gamma domain-containing protein n=1 Tax=Mesocestoides corti TaxID=53468 RepID=A0A5K3FT39_MESCO